MTQSYLQLITNTKVCIRLLLGGGRRGGERGAGAYCQVFLGKKARGAEGGEGSGSGEGKDVVNGYTCLEKGKNWQSE
jgi:hypothetical protein